MMLMQDPHITPDGVARLGRHLAQIFRQDFQVTATRSGSAFPIRIMLQVFKVLSSQTYDNNVDFSDSPILKNQHFETFFVKIHYLYN